MLLKRSSLTLFAMACTASFASVSFAQIAPASVSLGETVQASLADSDANSVVRSGAKTDRYTLVGVAGQTLQISMISEAFDTYLYLYDQNGAQLAADDDGLGNLDSRIRFTLPSAGTYTIEATAFSSGFGDYSLLVEEYVPRPISFQQIEVNSSVTSSFSSADGESTYSGPAQAWMFDATAGMRYEIRASSQMLSPALSLVGPGGVAVATGTYGAGDGSMVINYTAGVAGVYSVVVTGGYAGAYGEYNLSVHAHELSTSGPAALPVGTTTSGALDGSDSTDVSGYTFDAWRLEPTGGRVVSIAMNATDFVPGLTVVDQNGEQVAYQDDNASAGVASVAFVAAEDTSYTVIARTAYGGAGTYTLTTAERRPVEVEPRRLRIGQTVEGSLDTADVVANSGTGYADVYVIEAEAGARASVSLTSNSTAQLRIVAPTGEVVHEEYGYGIMPYSTFEEGFDPSINGGSPSSSWTGTFGQTGNYLVAVLGAALVDSTYSLTTAAVDAGSAAPQHLLGATDTGRFETTDPFSATAGTAADTWIFEVEEAGRYHITATNNDGNQWEAPTLILRNTQTAALHWGSTDASAPTSHLFVDLVPGTYAIVLGGYTSGYTYSLSSTAVEAMPIVVTPISLGATVDGTLATSSAIAPDRAAPAAFYSIALAAGDTLNLSIASPTFNPTATLYNELGEWVASVDTYGGTWSHTAGAPSLLTIVVAGYSMSDVGAYTLTAAPRP